MQTKSRGIISLIVILSVGFFALSAALTVAISSFSGLLDNRNTKFGDFAFYTSEAAAKEGFSQLKEDTEYSGGFIEEINSSSGDILVTELEWPYYEVEGFSDNKFNTRSNVFTITTFAEGLAFKYAVFSETDLNFKGNVVVNGNIFANEGIDFSGSSVDINGDAFSSVEITDTDNINGDVFDDVEPIPSPSIDVESYLALADFVFDNSGDAQTYINGNTIINQVIFIDAEGKVNIQGAGTNFSGCLVVIGNLDITGGTFAATENYPAIIVQGNLKIAGGATINGVVYVTGETSFGGGNNTINGSLLSVGDITTSIDGHATINFDPEYVSVWETTPGLDTTSSVDPRIIDWRQE